MPRQPAFWSEPGHLLSLALSPVGALVGRITLRRMARPPAYRSHLPVVCIGNLTAGGQGKTPLALAVAEALTARGRVPVFLTRGYGGRIEGPVRVGREHTARDVGDEPMLLAGAGPCIVAADRAAGARHIESLSGDLGSDPVIVMDDGFQNPGLAKTLSLLAVDAGFGLGNGRVLPAGPLRAPHREQLAHAQAVVVIGEGPAAEPLVAAAREAGLAIRRAKLEPDRTLLAPGTPVVAYAGIGRPEKFFETVRGLGLDLRQAVPFPDHHQFTRDDATRLLALADRENARLLTTQKDRMRLDGNRALQNLRAASLALPVRLVLTETDGLSGLLEAAGL